MSILNHMRSGPWLSALAWVGMGLFAVGLPAQGGATEAPSGSPFDPRLGLEQYVETRRIHSKEKRDWAVGKQMLENQVSVASSAIAGVESKTAEAEASLATARTARQEMQTRLDALSADEAALVARVAAMEARTLDLMKRTPERVRNQLAMLVQQIPAPGAETKLSAAERVRTVVGLMNELNKFNFQIALHREMRELGDGRTAEVPTLYLGLGHAYYVTDDGLSAGVGAVTDAGWTWFPRNQDAAVIAKAIAVFESRESPVFVPVPLAQLLPELDLGPKKGQK